MPRTYLLLAAACIGGDAQMPPCPAGVKDDLNWYTTTSSGKVHDCAWLRIDPDTRCNNDGRFLNCPAACGKCLGVCQNDERDDDTWLRKHEAADGPHGCAWAAEEPRNRCFEMGADGRRSGEACEAACGFCVGAPSWPHSEGPDGPIMDDVDPFPAEGAAEDDGPTAFNNDDEVDDNGVENDDDDDEADAASCADDPQWQKLGSKTKACAWVAEKFSRCDTPGADGRDAIEACKAACGMCATPAPVARKAREDPKAKMLPTGYVFFLVGASLAMLVLCGIQCKTTLCRQPVRYGGVGSDTIISVSDDPDDEGFEMSGSSSMV